MRWIARILAAFVVMAAGMGSAQAPGAKLALVIGIGDYGRDAAAQQAGNFVSPPPLVNAVRDAALVADALQSKGFTVTRVLNPDRRTMLAAVNTFGQALTAAGPDAVGLFYFAGHGAQGRPALERDIDNYLVPLGTSLSTEIDLESEALGLSRISEKLRPGPRGATVIILDACRDFALPQANRSIATRGLAEARAAPGTFIAYATAPGATAQDGAAGQNGPYAKALATQVRAAAGTRLEDVFIAVRNSVQTETRGKQVPWESGSLRRAVTLGIAPVATPVVAVDRSQLPAPPPPKTRPGESFTECAECPEMVVVPSGHFVMGSPEIEAGRDVDEPQRQVTIAHPFAAARFEVTFAQWDACVAAGGCALPYEPRYSPADSGWGRGNRPVINVSWQDAKSYVGWLNGRVGGKAYRLLSESEWEYVARAGTTTPFSFGATISASQANYNGEVVYGAGQAGEYRRKTMPVGSFPANAFGLYDTHGNVWEWVEDCFTYGLNGAPLDGSPIVTGSCEHRVLRGGAWDDGPSRLRSAGRSGSWPNSRTAYYGFRVARTVLPTAP